MDDKESTVLSADGEFHVADEEVDLSVYRFEDWIAFGFFWLLAANVFYQFFTRYVLNNSAAWTEEIARYLLICTVFVGAAIGVRKNTQIQVDFFYHVFPAGLMRMVSIAVDVAKILFLGYSTYLTYSLITKIGQQSMAIVDIPMGTVYGVVMFGFAIMTYRAVGVMVSNIRRGYSVLERPELFDNGVEIAPKAVPASAAK